MGRSRPQPNGQKCICPLIIKIIYISLTRRPSRVIVTLFVRTPSSTDK